MLKSPSTRSIPLRQLMKVASAAHGNRSEAVNKILTTQGGYPGSCYESIEDEIARCLPLGPGGSLRLAEFLRNDTRLNDKSRANALFAFNSFVTDFEFIRIGDSRYRFSIQRKRHRIPLVFHGVYLLRKRGAKDDDRIAFLSFQMSHSSGYRLNREQLQMFLALAIDNIYETKEFRSLIAIKALPFENEVDITGLNFDVGCLLFNNQSGSIMFGCQDYVDRWKPTLTEASEVIDAEIEKLEPSPLLNATEANKKTTGNLFSEIQEDVTTPSDTQDIPEVMTAQDYHSSSDTGSLPVAYAEAFVLMPFESTFNGVWFAIESACKSVGITAKRADTEHHNTDIWEYIKHSITSTKIAIVDISGDNRNTPMEFGFAQGIAKKVVLIAQQSSDLPSNIRNIEAIIYDNTVSGLKKLTHELIDMLRRLLWQHTSRVLTPDQPQIFLTIKEYDQNDRPSL